MTRFRLRAMLIGVAVLVGAAGSAGPAVAHATISLRSPAPDQELTTANSTVTAQLTLGSHTIGETTVDRAEMTLEAVGTDRPLITASASPSPSGAVAFPVDLPYNGRYRVNVSATWTHSSLVVGERSDVARDGPRDFFVAAPPANPADVKVAVDPASRVVTVTWRANPEPDMLFYILQRAKGTSTEFATVGGKVLHPETTFVDASTAEAGGEYRYQVVAVRNGIEDGVGINSDPSALTPQSTAAVPEPPPPPTDPTAAAEAAAAGGTPSGSTLPANNPGALTTSGKVDLNGFTTVQSQARRTPRTVPPPDTGFQSTLPFAPSDLEEEEEVEEAGELGEVAADSPQFRELGSTDESADRQRTMAFFAAGLLATVLLMHVLWVKGEVNRVPLEAVTPEGVRPAPAKVKTPSLATDWFVPDRLGVDASSGRVAQGLGQRRKVSSDA